MHDISGRCRLSRLAAMAAAVTAAASATAADWPCWRGPTRDGRTDEPSGFTAGKWLPARPAWSASVGMGGTSPIVVGEKVYVMGWRAERDTVTCLDAATGRVVWKQSYTCPKYGRRHHGDEKLYGGPSATPSFDRDTERLFTLGNDGDLIAWNARDGKRLWSENFYDRYSILPRPNTGQAQRDYGYPTAPLVYGHWVIVMVGSRKGLVVAYDKRSGMPAWFSRHREPAGHVGGLVPLTVGKTPCLAVLTLHRLVVMRLDRGHEGETLTTFEWQTDFGNNIPTPTVVGDTLLLSAGYNRSRTVRLRVTPQGVTKLWESRLFTGVCCPVVSGDYLYFARNTLNCLDLRTGATVWKGGSYGPDVSLVLTRDRRLIVWGHRKLALVETAERSPKSYRELASRRPLGSGYSWPHVVLSGGRLFVKDLSGKLFCFALSR